jgi:hypothetical protein
MNASVKSAGTGLLEPQNAYKFLAFPFLIR